ncbi:unnamed protein product [Rotaria sordida]|uniref:Uncharacterized protein n=2 Tax=Rotaria sordida TaxID=392033 RepID=A0A814FG51_9BILA|nr:unnamed protein product [Rotaria sordida]CAF1056542.1 unnamed protein product [Rotaria sordida]
MNAWIQSTKQEIQMKINQILPGSDWQKSIQNNEETNRKLLMTNVKFLECDIYQHLCEDLKTSPNNQILRQTMTFLPGIKKYNVSSNVIQDDYVPSIKELTEKFNYTIGIALTRIEIWVESRLNQWINHPTIYLSGRDRFETLLDFFEEYQNAALNHYWSEKGPTDPMGYSRYILTSLTIIRLMHQKLCNDSRFERLKQHSINIPNLMKLFEFLVLPNRNDMIRVYDLRHYFSEFSNKTYPDLLTSIDDVNAFGVYCASQSSEMNESIQKIRAQAERDKQQKIQEVTNAKERYTGLMNSIRGMSCSCSYKYGYHRQCHRCTIEEQAMNVKVHIYECPLPSKREQALAVIFELQMPLEIRNYRDTIWQFINRPKPCPPHKMHEWLSIPPHASKLGPFYTSPSNCKVKLVSSTKSVTQNYSYSPFIGSTSIEGFLHENSLTVEILPTKSIGFDDECRILTPQLNHPDYKQLQLQ